MPRKGKPQGTPCAVHKKVNKIHSITPNIYFKDEVVLINAGAQCPIQLQVYVKCYINKRSGRQDCSPYDGIRGRWEAASLAQFLKLFQYKFNFSCVTTQELEAALIDGRSVLLADTCARLLRFLTGSTDIIINNFEQHLKTAVEEAGKAPQVGVLLGNQAWNALVPEDKVVILKWLADYVLEERGEELKEHLDGTWRPDDMRGLCAGQDAFNNVYWYLDDLRLYRENNVKKANRKDWECVCVTLQDWVCFLKQFRKTTNPQERELYHYLNVELFPIIESQLRDITEQSVKENLPNNKDLLQREQEDLAAMIKENKEKREKKNGNTVNVKVEPQALPDTTLKEENVLNGEDGGTGCDVPMNTNIGSGNSGLGSNGSGNGSGVNNGMSSGNNCSASSQGGSTINSGGHPPCSTNSTSGSGEVQQNMGGTNVSNGGAINSGTKTSTSVSACSGSVSGSENCMLQNSQEAKPGTTESSLAENLPACSAVKTEETSTSNSSQEFSADPCQNVTSIGMGLQSSACAASDGVQPLPSNVINKQPGTMEAQYMQQQSQIFVFSTTRANKAAEAVLQGQFTSIIAYHCADPGTKKFLEKHPLKMNQFNRQNPAQWLNSLAQMKQKGGPGAMRGLNSLGPPSGFQGSNNMLGEMGPVSGSGPMGTWNQSNNTMTSVANMSPAGSGGNPVMQSCPNNVMSGCPVSSPIMQGNSIMPGGPIKSSGMESPLMQGPGMMVDSPNSGGPNMVSGSSNTTVLPGPSPTLPPVTNSMMPGSSDVESPGINPVNSSSQMVNVQQPSLTGVKVPDENLTPQQRQHREEQLATLRKMQQILFPEHQSAGTPDGVNMGSGPAQSNMMGQSQPLLPSQQGTLPQQGMIVSQGVMLSPQAAMMGMGPGGNGNGGGNGSNVMMNQKNMMMGQAMMPGSGPGPNLPPPTSMAAQLQWQELQRQFFEDKKKKIQPGMMNVPVGGPNVMVGPVGQQMGSGQGVGRGVAPGPRMQGPPPPYHQTTRSASVPTAVPSPTPSSPTNPTSNLSLPSPRAASGLSSPAEPNRQFSISGNSRLPGPSPNSLHSTPMDSPNPSRPLNPSNPGTPVSTSTHPSPNMGRKEIGQQNGSNEFPATTQSSGGQPPCSTPSVQAQAPVDGMFGRTLQSFAQQKQQQNHSAKEPNLMPVPSPQQIQYLNAFEGQELTIQKQPNTSLRDTDMMSPSLPPSSLDGGLPTTGTVTDPSGPRLSGPNTPLTPSSVELGPRYPGPHTPHTPGEVSRFPVPSPHTPGAPEKGQRFPGPSPQSQGPRTPGIEPPAKTPTLESGGPRFPSTSPQLGDGMGPPRFPGSGVGTGGASGPVGSVGTTPVMSNQSQNFSGPPSGGQKSGAHFPDLSPSKGSSVDVSPTGGGFPCSQPDNVPLNPNSNGSGAIGNKSAHFDPITSMAQMSQQLTSSVANSPGQSASLMSSMATMSMSTPTSMGGPGPQMVPFNTAMHSMQGIQPLNDGSLQVPPTTGGAIINSVGNLVPGSQGMGNTFGNASMTMQQMNMQNIPPSSYSPGMPMGGLAPQNVNPMMGAGNMLSSCSSTVSTATSMNHPIMHTSASPKSGMGNMMMGASPRGPSPVVPYTAPMGPQRMMNPVPGMGRPPGPGPAMQGPYNGASVQVKASAPNTIQYLPARPQTTNPGPRGPPSLDFLQRFASPLSNLDSKVPTHNLQYFPNSSQANSVNMGGPNVPMSISGPMGGPMSGINAPMGGPMSGPGGAMSGAMGPNAPMSGPMGGPMSGPMGSLNGPLAGPNGPMMGPSVPMTGMNGPMVMSHGAPGMGMGPLGPGPLRGGPMSGQTLGPRTPGSHSAMMRGPGSQQLGGSGMFGAPSNNSQTVGGEQMFVPAPNLPSGPVPGGPNQMMSASAPNSQMFVPGAKSSPLGMGGAPDASQPLPPSMGQSGNFKNSPFIGPTTADPNYAQQFHNFQQQLYATNTRSQMGNQTLGSNQSFFGPK